MRDATLSSNSLCPFCSIVVYFFLSVISRNDSTIPRYLHGAIISDKLKWYAFRYGYLKELTEMIHLLDTSEQFTKTYENQAGSVFVRVNLLGNISIHKIGFKSYIASKTVKG